ncbi:MAG: hypothetical protein AAB654_14865 [Acidobacteriota bacterium]
MKKLLLLVCLGAMTVLAQGQGPGQGTIVPFPLFSPELQKYLDLSNAQVDAIRRANMELTALSARKQFRMAQVQAEIRDWTAKDPIDAMQLGVRYAELEGLRREIGDEQKKAVAKVRGTLNAAQLAKLKVLEDAVKLQPLINDAVCENLMSPAAPQPMGVIGRTPGGVIGFGDMSIPQVVSMPFANCVRGVISPMPMDPGPRP